jgi:hypothetical protein
MKIQPSEEIRSLRLERAFIAPEEKKGTIREHQLKHNR